MDQMVAKLEEMGLSYSFPIGKGSLLDCADRTDVKRWITSRGFGKVRGELEKMILMQLFGFKINLRIRDVEKFKSYFCTLDDPISAVAPDFLQGLGLQYQYTKDRMDFKPKTNLEFKHVMRKPKQARKEFLNRVVPGKPEFYVKSIFNYDQVEVEYNRYITEKYQDIQEEFRQMGIEKKFKEELLPILFQQFQEKEMGQPL